MRIKSLAIILTLIVVISSTAIGCQSNNTEEIANEKYTEFCILKMEGKLDISPRELMAGEEGRVVLVIVNHEHETMSYRLEVWIDGEQVNVWLNETELEVMEVELAHEEKWEHQIGFIPQQAGDGQEVEFRLFKNEDSETYLNLNFGITVSPA